jgi:predicted transcriptional regulator
MMFVYNVFFTKSVELLKMVNDSKKRVFILSASRSMDLNFNTIMEYVDILKENGLVVTTKEGRTRYITMTSKGKKFVDFVNKMNKLMG